MHFRKKELDTVNYYEWPLPNYSNRRKDLGLVISSDTKSSQQCIQAYSKASRILPRVNRTIGYKKIKRIYYISNKKNSL